MSYDPAIGQMVLFGGVIGTNLASADTWTFNGTTWTKQSPTASPPARALASMAYDPTTSQMVLFGGVISTNNGSGYSIFGDTWTYNGTTWTEQSLSPSPPSRFGATMDYDPAMSEMILVGGGDSSTVVLGKALADTWVYEDSAWTQQSPSTSPPARSSAQMAYDPAMNQMLLYGGFTDNSANDTWAYPGSSQAITFTSTVPAQGIRGGTTYSPTATSSSGLDVTLSLDASSIWLLVRRSGRHLYWRWHLRSRR